MTSIDDKITRRQKSLQLHPPGDTGRAEALGKLANSLRDRFLEKDAIADIDDAIALHRSALDLRPASHPNRSTSLNNLTDCLLKRYRKQATIADLDEAVSFGRAALELWPADNSQRVVPLSNLAACLMDKFQIQGKDTDLDEAISLCRSALDLCLAGDPHLKYLLHKLVFYLSSRFDKQETTADLDELITLYRTILNLEPSSHLDHATSLDKLLFHVRERYHKLGLPADLDESISLGRDVLALPNPGHPNRITYLLDLASDHYGRFQKIGVIADLEEAITLGRTILEHPHLGNFLAISLHSLTVYVKDMIVKGGVVLDECKIVNLAQASATLATFFRSRFHEKGAIEDLDEAIVLCRGVLEVCPSGNVACAASLHELSCCLSDRFKKLARIADLDNAIKFEQAALDLCPDHAESLNRLSYYHELKIKGRSAIPQSTRRPTGPAVSPQIKKLIGDVVFEVLRGFPPRLLHTPTGILCDRSSQMSRFEKSLQYKQLLSSASALEPPLRSGHIRSVISTYFGYVTLSHRWGKCEPLLRDIEGRGIYDMDPTDGISKLQSFCLASCKHRYLWAWSDTCCIDKESSAELQEAIGSMFTWYRRSALTIVYLADVSHGGALSSSEWFKRGWTLQELLAPYTMLFFTRDWSLYKDGSPFNHKENGVILGELEQTTGIASHHLTNFYPGVDDVRSKLQWASARCTTRPEDIAYSLFGIFNLYLPILYGESAENALGRLFAEIISKSGDTSILDWVGQSSSYHSCFPPTITPHQIHPASQSSPDDQRTPPPRSVLRHIVTRSTRAARKMHQVLSDLPLTQFTNFRLILPCIIFRIQTIALIRGDVDTAHVYQIQGVGIEPIEIAISEKLDNMSRKGVPYILIRPWHSDLLDPSVEDDDTSAQQWLVRLQKPFSALLLTELPHNEYRRVASSCSITVSPTDSTGVLKGEVSILTIV
ncbi:hypothetical protein V8B97DRAFT_2004332 [Scleroderma yunnanense]